MNALATIRQYLEENGLEYEPLGAHGVVVTLPGVHKLRTSAALVVGTHALTVNAFVARKPDENVPLVHEWLLERNRSMFSMSFAIDQYGDIYLTAILGLEAVNDLDRILGSVLEYSDSAFNVILELGFASAIKREYVWRTSHGESVDHLAAFAHLIETR